MNLTIVPPPVLTTALFQQLYRQHAGRLCGYLTKSLRGDKAEAECIVQEAFLKGWEKRHDLRDVTAFRSWIFSIAMNVLRQRKRTPSFVVVKEVDAICGRPSPEQQAEAGEELNQALAALDRLPEDQREAILLVRMENMLFREAAEVLGVPESTVKTRVRRGLLKLAQELDL
jgi:RNA polymerase sigma-70 factor, ECF subfamily